MARPTRSSSNHRPRAQRSGRHRERAQAVRRPKTVGGVPPALALALLVVATYLPALRAGFIWDDDAYVTANTTLRSLDGLRRIWLEPGARPAVLPAHLHEPPARPSPLGSPTSPLSDPNGSEVAREGSGRVRLDGNHPVVRRDRCAAYRELAEIYTQAGEPEAAAETRRQGGTICALTAP